VLHPSRFCLLVLVASLSLGACAEPETPSAAAPEHSEAQAESGEMIAFGEALAQIRGHHLASLELYKAGDNKGASLHAGHPIAEILDSVRSELGEHDPELAQSLAEALEAGAAAVTGDKPADEVAAAFDRAEQATGRALTEVVGDESQSAAYQGSVIALLLDTVVNEYDEAVGDDGLRLLAEYQDGYAFTREARNLYGDIAAEVEAASAEEAEEIESAFKELEKALPSVQPPKRLALKLDVKSAAELVALELEETVGAEPVEQSDPADVVARIEGLLGEIAKTYAAGDADAAAELSAEAYLENYELIEAEVIELAPEVNEELEPLLGADLRRQIQAGASQEEIESMIARARVLLHDALEAVEEGH